MVNQLIPGSRMYGDMARMIPGLVSTSAPEHRPPRPGVVGHVQRVRRHRRVMVLIDGFEIRSNTYPDFGRARRRSTSRASATPPTSPKPGRSGTWSASPAATSSTAAMPSSTSPTRFQSNNLDDELRSQGLSFTDSVIHFSDFNSDLGGRIIAGQAVVLRQLSRSAQQALGGGPRARARRGRPVRHGRRNAASARGLDDELDGQAVVPASRPSITSPHLWRRDYSTNDGGAQSSKAAQRFIPYEAATYQTVPGAQLSRRVPRDAARQPPAQRPGRRHGLHGHLSRHAARSQQRQDHGAVGSRNRDLHRRQHRSGRQLRRGDPSAHQLGDAGQPDVPAARSFCGGGHEFKVGFRAWIQEGHTDVPGPCGRQLPAHLRPRQRPSRTSRSRSRCSTSRCIRRTATNSLSGYINDRWQLEPAADAQPRRALRLRPLVPAGADQRAGAVRQRRDVRGVSRATPGRTGRRGSVSALRPDRRRQDRHQVHLRGRTTAGMADTFAQTFNQNAVSQTIVPLARPERQQRLRRPAR